MDVPSQKLGKKSFTSRYYSLMKLEVCFLPSFICGFMNWSIKKFDNGIDFFSFFFFFFFFLERIITKQLEINGTTCAKKSMISITCQTSCKIVQISKCNFTVKRMYIIFYIFIISSLLFQSVCFKNFFFFHRSQNNNFFFFITIIIIIKIFPI